MYSQPPNDAVIRSTHGIVNQGCFAVFETSSEVIKFQTKGEWGIILIAHSLATFVDLSIKIYGKLCETCDYDNN